MFDTYHNSNITGSATGPNTLTGGDGGGLAGTGNTITGGSGSDTIITGLGANTVNLGATHGTDSVTIGSGFGGVITSAGDHANQGSWGQAFGSTPTFIAGPAPSLFGNALNGGTSAERDGDQSFRRQRRVDHLQFEAALWNPTLSANNIGGVDGGLLDIGFTARVMAGTAPVFELATSGGALTPTANFIEIGGSTTYANAAALAAGLQSSFDLVTGGLPTHDNVHLLVAYSNGTNIHIADVDLYNTTAATTPASTSDHVYASDMVNWWASTALRP